MSCVSLVVLGNVLALTVRYTHADRRGSDLDSADMSTQSLAVGFCMSHLQKRCILGELVVLSVVADVDSCVLINYSCA